MSVVAAVAVTQGRRAEGRDKRRQEAGSETGSGARSPEFLPGSWQSSAGNRLCSVSSEGAIVGTKPQGLRVLCGHSENRQSGF